MHRLQTLSIGEREGVNYSTVLFPLVHWSVCNYMLACVDTLFKVTELAQLVKSDHRQILQHRYSAVIARARCENVSLHYSGGVIEIDNLFSYAEQVWILLNTSETVCGRHSINERCWSRL